MKRRVSNVLAEIRELVSAETLRVLMDEGMKQKVGSTFPAPPVTSPPYSS